MTGTKRRTLFANTRQNFLLPRIARGYLSLVEPHVSAKAGDRVTQPPGGVGVLMHIADEDGRSVRSETTCKASPRACTQGGDGGTWPSGIHLLPARTQFRTNAAGSMSSCWTSVLRQYVAKKFDSDGSRDIELPTKKNC